MQKGCACSPFSLWGTPVSLDIQQWCDHSVISTFPSFQICVLSSSLSFAHFVTNSSAPALYLSGCSAIAVAACFDPSFTPTSVTPLIAGDTADIFCCIAAFNKTGDPKCTELLKTDALSGLVSYLHPSSLPWCLMVPDGPNLHQKPLCFTAEPQWFRKVNIFLRKLTAS